MCFSQYLALLESLFLLILTKFENVTSHRIAQGKITRQNATIVHRVGSQNSPQGMFKSAILCVKLAWMCFSQYLALLESIIVFTLARFENVTSHRIARGKITKQNPTIVHRVGSQNSPQGTLKARFNA